MVTCKAILSPVQGLKEKLLKQLWIKQIVEIQITKWWKFWHQKHLRGTLKIDSCHSQSKLCCYQLEIPGYKMFYVSITKQSFVVDAQNINWKIQSVSLQKTMKPQRKTAGEKKMKQSIYKITRKQTTNDSNKSLPTNNYFECK